MVSSQTQLVDLYNKQVTEDCKLEPEEELDEVKSPQQKTDTCRPGKALISIQKACIT